MRYLILFAAVLAAGCKSFDPLAIDPCAILPGIDTCYAVPINQPGKPEYERVLTTQDICVTIDEYAELQKHYRELMKRCGKKCE